LRSRWLNPPEWVRPEILEFPATLDGPWAAVTRNVNKDGIGTARYVRLTPVDEKAGQALKKRTLTSLYNDRPTWLRDAHRTLDEAVFEAYGWDSATTDAELLASLLERNLALHETTARVPRVKPTQPELPILRRVMQKAGAHAKLPTLPILAPVMAKADVQRAAKRRRPKAS